MQRLARGEALDGDCVSDPNFRSRRAAVPALGFRAPTDRDGGRCRSPARPFGGGIPLLASRGCPEFCTYCPHRILAGHRARSVGNIVDELEALTRSFSRPYVIFRDPLFTNDRDRAMALADEIRVARPRLCASSARPGIDRLDPELLDDAARRRPARDQLRRRVGVARHPQEVSDAGRRRKRSSARSSTSAVRTGVVTAAFYVLGFPHDDWSSIAATIDYSIDLGSTVAQFKLLTPYPGTPLWKQLGAAGLREGLAEVRRLHADLRASEPEAGRAQVPARRGLQPLLPAAVVS